MRHTTIHVDEFSMVPKKLITMLSQAHTTVEGVNVIRYGEPETSDLLMWKVGAR